MDDQENGKFDIHNFLSGVPYDQWISVHPSGWRPLARYKHAAEVVLEKLYVVGGSRNGRYISDVQVLDLRNFQWSKLDPTRDPDASNFEDNTLESVFPACGGHCLVHWGRNLLVVGGYLKKSSDTVTVWSIDLDTQNYKVVKTFGSVPTARGGQTVTLVGSRLIMFGGEDSRRHLLNDIHILDLETMTWEIAQTKKTSPAPRFDHTAEVHADRYLLIFGGSSHSTCFHDLHVLDLETMEWSQPEIHGSCVTPRGGHAGASIDENWYIVGGGDNRSGATETLVLDMSKLAWSIVTTVKERDPLASEGLTLSSATIDGEKFLIAFGGYNGRFNNEVYLLKPKRRDFVHPRLFQSPAAAAAAASVSAAYSLTTATNKMMNTVNKVNSTLLTREDGSPTVQETEPAYSSTTVTNDMLSATNKVNSTLLTLEDVSSVAQETDTYPKAISVEVDAISAEKRILEARLMEVRTENSRFMDNLEDINNSYAELSMELQSVQGQLVTERSRCFKLELQISEMRKRLESLSSIEQELEALRQQKSREELAAASGLKQKPGGVWQWVTGTTQTSDD